MEGFACFFNFGTLLLRRLVARSFRGEGWCEFFSLFLCMFFSFLWPPLQFFLRLLLLAVRGRGEERERESVLLVVFTLLGGVGHCFFSVSLVSPPLDSNSTC